AALGWNASAGRSPVPGNPLWAATCQAQHDPAEREAADVRPPGDAAMHGPGEREGAAEELEHEPQAEHERGRQRRDLEEREERDERHHPRAREFREVGAE